MSVLDNYSCEGQMSLFDLDSQFTKTLPESSVQTKVKTSDVSSKKQRKSSIKMPLYLDLRKESGKIADASWETDGVSLGEYMMPNIGEYHNDEEGFVYSQISTDTQQENSYLMLGYWEKPNTPTPSKLSQILEKNPNPKYNLSAKACQGILNRATKRGKQLPPLLEKTLKQQAQSLSKSEQENPAEEKESSSKTNEPEPCQPSTSKQSCLNPWDVQSKHIQSQDGIAESLYSGECRYGGGESYVLDEGPLLLESNQNHATVQTDGICTALPASMGMGGGYIPMVVKKRNPVVYGIGSYSSNAMMSDNPHSGIYEAETTRTLDNNGGNPACNQGGMIILNENSQENMPVVLEGNGSRPSHLGDGYKESDVMYTLNATEQHGVCYGFDRAAYNQGQNALYDFAVEEELAQPLVARGPGGVMSEQ